MNELRPPSLIRFGLAKALAIHLDNQHDKYPNVPFDTHFQEDGKELPEQARLNLYRIVQEAIENAIKHADATRIIIQYACNQLQGLLPLHAYDRLHP